MNYYTLFWNPCHTCHEQFKIPKISKFQKIHVYTATPPIHCLHIQRSSQNTCRHYGVPEDKQWQERKGSLLAFGTRMRDQEDCRCIGCVSKEHWAMGWELCDPWLHDAFQTNQGMSEATNCQYDWWYPTVTSQRPHCSSWWDWGMAHSLPWPTHLNYSLAYELTGSHTHAQMPQADCKWTGQCLLHGMDSEYHHELHSGGTVMLLVDRMPSTMFLLTVEYSTVSSLPFHLMVTWLSGFEGSIDGTEFYDFVVNDVVSLLSLFALSLLSWSKFPSSLFSGEEPSILSSESSPSEKGLV